MPILSKLFHRDDRGASNDGYYIARDTAIGDVFVIHKWSEDAGEGQSKNHATRLDLTTFLKRKGAAQESLLNLIGLIATTEDIPW